MKDKNYKLHKEPLGKKLIALGTVISILVGSGVYYGIKKNYPKYSDSQSVTYSYNYGESSPATTSSSDINYNSDLAFVVSDAKDNYIEPEYKDFLVSFNTNDLNLFKEYLKSLDSSYTYEELYDIDTAYDKYKNMNFSNVSNENVIISSESLYDYVVKNNKEYFGDESNLESVAYSELSKSDLKAVCNELCEGIKQYVSDNSNINIESVNKLLKELRVLTKRSDMAHARYFEDNLLLVNMKKIEDYGKLKNIDNAFERVINHEAAHICQRAADDNLLDDINQMGICYEFDGLRNNPFYWNWFLEASAELQMMELLDVEQLTYPTQISYYKSLILTSILNERVSLDEFNEISYSKDVQKIFDAFDAKSKEEQIEIIKMLYSIEIMQSEPSDFYDAFKEKYNVSMSSEEVENLRLCLRIDILETMTKEFYKSLANKASDGLTLNTIFYLIQDFEAKVYTHLHYNEKARIASGVDFFDFYKNIQDEFFEMISKNTNYELDEIIEMYNNYSMNIIEDGVKKKNYSLTSFDESTSNFLNEIEEENYFADIKNLRDMPEYCKENGYTQTNYSK